MTEKTRDEVLAEYEAAARRSTALGHRWEQMVLIEPLRPANTSRRSHASRSSSKTKCCGRGRTTFTKRNAYLAATNTLEPA